MKPDEAVRLVTALGAIEMCLVRRDAVTGPLLAQATRAAEGLPVESWLRAARDLARTVDLAATDDASAAVRKVAQALCRAAAQAVQGELLRAAAVAA